MSFAVSDEAFFAEALTKHFGDQFDIDRYQSDLALNRSRQNASWVSYHDLRNRRNRTHISTFGVELDYAATESAAVHSSILFILQSSTFHFERWQEESWRITGHAFQAEAVCFVTLYRDDNGWGLASLEKMKAAGQALTMVYEATEQGRLMASNLITAFLHTARAHAHPRP